ncbi:MAG: heavy-metal-associated domain-containing protein [Lachnospiraceae bacterium]|nr:heavy-metal-associated domain-containing protein [Lachnospiraceae bacterium]
MGDIVIIGVIVLLVLLAVPSSIKHFKGQGGCCGGGSTVKEHKKLDAPKLGEKEIRIEGMHCDHCKTSVERAVNKIDGAVCKVNLKKKVAKVSYSKEIPDEVLRQAVEEAGFQVVEIVS